MSKRDRNKSDSTYFTVRYAFVDPGHRRGEAVAASAATVRIGERPDCDVAVTNDTGYADELYAVIKPAADGRGWVIVPASETVTTELNGLPVQLARRLHDSDRISFSGQGVDARFVFNVHRDERFDGSERVLRLSARPSRSLVMAMVAVPVLICGLLALYFVHQAGVDRHNEQVLADTRSSVLQLSVDSVFYIMNTPGGSEVLRTYSYVAVEGHAVSGTAFLTADSLLVTARHCIEPWLNDADAASASSMDEIASIPARWAIEAETYNQLNPGDTTFTVAALCTFAGGATATAGWGRSVLSTAFAVDDSRDEIVETGDYDTELYRRSIVRRGARTDMMLGDAAFIRTDSAGSIVVAPQAELPELAADRSQVFFIGYPGYQERGLETSEGVMRRQFAPGQMLAHSGRLLHGYSGAPVLVIDGDRAVAVGIISVIDSSGGDRTYSVPINELRHE